MTEDFLANLGNCGDMPEFRPQLASKICLLALKFDEDPKWQIETLVEILSMRSIDVSEETRNEFCQIVEKVNYTVLILNFTILILNFILCLQSR